MRVARTKRHNGQLDGSYKRHRHLDPLVRRIISHAIGLTKIGWCRFMGEPRAMVGFITLARFSSRLVQSPQTERLDRDSFFLFRYRIYLVMVNPIIFLNENGWTDAQLGLTKLWIR
jgi:hypothetical protein